MTATATRLSPRAKRARVLVPALMVALLSAASVRAAVSPGLILESTIALPGVPGRIDHMAVDLARHHLFVAEVGNGAVDVVDLGTKRPIHRIAKIGEAQGVAYS